MRASHEDRDGAVERLRVAAGDGRLMPEELDERVERALTARTYGELEALLADLPAVPGVLAPAPAAKDLVQLRSRSGHITREGPWVVPRRMEVEARSGHVRLDFTHAVVTEPTLDLVVRLHSGHLRLIVPPGVTVDTGDIDVRAGHVRDGSRPAPGAPLRLAVTVSGSVRSGHVLVTGPGRRAAPRTPGGWRTRVLARLLGRRPARSQLPG